MDTKLVPIVSDKVLHVQLNFCVTHDIWTSQIFLEAESRARSMTVKMLKFERPNLKSSNYKNSLNFGRDYRIVNKILTWNNLTQDS